MENEPGMWWGGRVVVTCAFSFFLGMIVEDMRIAATAAIGTVAIAAFFLGIDAGWIMVVATVSVIVGCARFGVPHVMDSKKRNGTNKTIGEPPMSIVNSQVVTLMLFVFFMMYGLRLSPKTTIGGDPFGLWTATAMFSAFMLLTYGAEFLDRGWRMLPIASGIGAWVILCFGVLGGYTWFVPYANTEWWIIVMHVVTSLVLGGLATKAYFVVVSMSDAAFHQVDVRTISIVYAQQSI
jgi:hypothetical protein